MFSYGALHTDVQVLANQPTRTYLQQLCADTECSEKICQERWIMEVNAKRESGKSVWAAWWWWWLYKFTCSATFFTIHSRVVFFFISVCSSIYHAISFSFYFFTITSMYLSFSFFLSIHILYYFLKLLFPYNLFFLSFLINAIITM